HRAQSTAGNAFAPATASQLHHLLRSNAPFRPCGVGHTGRLQYALLKKPLARRKKRDLTDLLEVGANGVSGSSKLRILASLTQGGRLIFVPDAGTSVFFFLFVFFLDVLIGFNEFFVVRYRWIEVSLRLLFILVSVNILLF